MSADRDRPRMRDDPAYWDALTARIVSRAAARPGRSAMPTATTWLARRSGPIAAATLAAAAILGAIWVSPPDVPSLTTALLPADPLGQAVARAPMPPSVGALLTRIAR